MGAPRRVKRNAQPHSIQCGDESRAPQPAMAPAPPDAPARVIAIRGGARWLVTVVARLVSEDMAAGVETARLVLRFECLTQPHRQVRVATVRALELDEVSDEMLRTLASAPAVRLRRRNA